MERPLKKAKKAPAVAAATAAAAEKEAIAWDVLPSSVKIEVACFLDTQECAGLRQLDKATRALMDSSEAGGGGLDSIRLSYLNNTSKNERSSENKVHDRFHRLIDLQVKPEYVWTFMESWHATPLKKTAHSTESQRIVLRHMFQHNRDHGHAPQFVVAGGSMLSCAMAYFKNEACQFGDIDVFLMELGHDRKESDAVLRNVLHKAGKELDAANHKYGVLRNPGTITMIVKENKSRPLQIVLRRVSCIEELLCFFDIDCCRFAFDGTKLWTTIEGLRSITLRKNFVSREHVDNEMYCTRAVKYGYRGFETLFHWVHPLSHLFNEHTPPFRIKKGIHSNATITNDPAQRVDFGWYSTFQEVDLSEIRSLANWNPETDDEPESDSEDEEPGHDENGNLLLEYRGRKRDLYQSLQKAGFADSFAEHFAKMRNPLFEHVYYESHLWKKYKMKKCYITGTWFKARSENECFSPQGRTWNDKFAGLQRDLAGQVAIVTGARVKIGFATALELLKQGATVVGTTRFVADAERRYAAEGDFFEYADRLILYPLNLKSTQSISDFVAFVKSKFKRVHILINNAAQTVRMPLRCYTNLIGLEFEDIGESLGVPSIIRDLLDPDITPDQALLELGERLEDHRSSFLTSGATTLARKEEAIQSVQQSLKVSFPSSNGHLFLPRPELLKALRKKKDDEIPKRELARLVSIRSLFENLHPDDLLPFRGDDEDDEVVPPDPYEQGKNDPSRNSWRLEPPQVHPIELFEAQTINHLAPTMLLNELVPLLSTGSRDHHTGPCYVINVTSIEGQFSVDVKESQHIHTNMSKAGLNMLTRSGAGYYAKRGILVNSVDTGWISSTLPTWTRPPLGIHDGAMRILHPILAQIDECGHLYKNYKQVDW